MSQRVRGIAVGTGYFLVASIMPGVWPASAQASGGGKTISVSIASCPTEPSREFIPPALLGAIAASAASSLTGAAIDAAIAYLAQERAATSSSGAYPLNEVEHKSLFGPTALGRSSAKCLYLYAPTSGLNTFLAQQSNTDLSNTTIERIDYIRKARLTPFFAVISFTQSAQKGTLPESKTTFYLPVVREWIYGSFLDTGCPLFRNCSRRDVAITLAIKNPVAPKPGETATKATPLSVGFQGSTVGAIEKRLKRPNGLGWFAYEPQGVNLANLDFSILETSKPGALANALVATAKANKNAIQQAVAGYVYSSPPTPAENVGLAEVALKEYKVYADLHQNAVEAYAQVEQNPLNIDARNQYNALKRQVSYQFDVVKAAWTAARISQRPVELAPLK